MYIERVPNRNSPPAVLLRESYREGSKVRKRTLANLSKLPDHAIDGLQALLKGGVTIASLPDSFKITRSRPHGHVAAVLGCLKNTGLHNLISSENSRNRRLVLAMIIARIIDPRSKLATARGFNEETCFSSIGKILGIEGADEDELYLAMDWLLSKQESIENNLAARHLASSTLVLYDVSSSYFEGKTCPLARYGYNRDGKRGKLQIVFGLMCDASGCPIALEVFEGNTADPTTLTNQITKLKERFGIAKIIWVGDRGIISSTTIQKHFQSITSVLSIGLARCVRYKSAAWSSKNRFNSLYLTNKTSLKYRQRLSGRTFNCLSQSDAGSRASQNPRRIVASDRKRISQNSLLRQRDRKSV
jgi:hypothetical protein